MIISSSLSAYWPRWIGLLLLAASLSGYTQALLKQGPLKDTIWIGGAEGQGNECYVDSGCYKDGFRVGAWQRTSCLDNLLRMRLMYADSERVVTRITYDQGIITSSDSIDFDAKYLSHRDFYSRGSVRRHRLLRCTKPYHSVQEILRVGKKTGEVQETKYYSNGNVEEVLNFLDGRKNGVYKYYYQNGRLKYDCYYIDGKLNGSYKTYNEKGELVSVVVYVDDMVQ